MARTGLVLDDVFQRHLTGPGHPECPERLVAISDRLIERGLADRCTRIAPRAIDVEFLSRVHSRGYVDRLARACERGDAFIDTADSQICGDSYNVALLAAGSILAAVDGVMAGDIHNAFCAIRPPGHHAERDASLGFCLLSNVAIAVKHLRERHGVGRVLILDWDVHHGNGTQHLLEEDPDAMFISIHGHPQYVYPGTGYAEETGRGAGRGATLNIPMLPGSRDADYRAAFDRQIRPVLETFAAEFILISAGFDAHRLDPLAPVEIETESFEWMSDMVLDAAGHHCDGRLVSVLEGGYHLGALADCVSLHVSRLLMRHDC
ncbi:MAG: histone deacetylase [Phycisphaerales bacterium]|nr:histone deacetylase [Phycisphaerales bacterium]